jgi:hypothetical protein
MAYSISPLKTNYINMKLSEIKACLPQLTEIKFQLPNGNFVPKHFHVTEVGMVTKNFIDCGGTVRAEKKINFQLWEAGDFDHRLAPQKLLNIIQLSEKILGLEDLEVEVEYQGETIGKYGIDFNGFNFMLTSTLTACLAQDQCGIPVEKSKIKLSDINVQSNSCTPGGGCC